MTWLASYVSLSKNDTRFRNENVNLSLFIEVFQCYPCKNKHNKQTKKLYYKNVRDEIKDVPRKFICNMHANVPFVIMVMGEMQTMSIVAI